MSGPARDLACCASCQAPVFAEACVCPACGATLRVCGSGRPLAAVLMGLTFAGCFLAAQPKYGIPLTDDDGDGYYADEDDCDDTNADVNPDADEVPGNGVDDDCDGQTDEADA